MKTCSVESNEKGFLFHWTDDKGFGQFVFWTDPQGKWHYDAETLHEDKVVEAFTCFLKGCKRVG